MTQHLFNSDSPATGSDKAVLDGMFTDLYDLREHIKTPSYAASTPWITFGAGGVLGFGMSPITQWDFNLASGMARFGGSSGNNLAQVYSGSNAIGLWAGGATYLYSNSAITFLVGGTVGTGYPTGGTNAVIIDTTGNILNVQAATGYSTGNSASVEGPNGRLTVSHVSGAASGALYAGFGYAGTQIGSITQSGTTGVAYNTSSDYRLKDNVQPVANSGAFIDALSPCTWTWKSDGTPGAGFIAHELQAVSPSSVSGVKDATQPVGHITTADGVVLASDTPQPAALDPGQTWTQTGVAPIYQAVEYGSAEVIAMMVAELKSLRARLHALDGH